MIMMLHRFLDNWIRIGLNYDSRRVDILLGVAIPALILVAFVLSLAGDSLLIVMDERGDPSDRRVIISLSLQFAGSIINI